MICEIRFYCWFLDNNALAVSHEDVVADVVFRIFLFLVDAYLVGWGTETPERSLRQCGVAPHCCDCSDASSRRYSHQPSTCSPLQGALSVDHVFEACFLLTQRIRWRSVSLQARNAFIDGWTRVKRSLRERWTASSVSEGALCSMNDQRHHTLFVTMVVCESYMDSLIRLFSGMTKRPNWKGLKKTFEQYVLPIMGCRHRTSGQSSSEEDSYLRLLSMDNSSSARNHGSVQLEAKWLSLCQSNIRTLGVKWITNAQLLWGRDRHKPAEPPPPLEPVSLVSSPERVAQQGQPDRFLKGTEWTLAQHPFRQCLEVVNKTITPGSLPKTNPYGVQDAALLVSDVMMRRPREIPLQVRTRDDQGISPGECRVFECEFLWKTTRCSVGSHPLVGVVSSKGKLPSVSHGTFEQCPHEFGWAVDLETSEVCFSYGAERPLLAAEGPGDEGTKSSLIRPAISRRKSSRLTQRTLGRLFPETFEEKESVDPLKRPGSFPMYDTDTQCVAAQGVAQFLAVRYLKSVSMVLPLRLTVNRKTNSIKATVPHSSMAYEEAFPELGLIEGPVYPAVGLSSGGFRGYFANSHPAWAESQLSVEENESPALFVPSVSRHPAECKFLALNHFALLPCTTYWLLDETRVPPHRSFNRCLHRSVVSHHGGSRTLRKALGGVPRRRVSRVAMNKQSGVPSLHTLAPKRFSVLRQPAGQPVTSPFFSSQRPSVTSSRSLSRRRPRLKFSGGSSGGSSSRASNSHPSIRRSYSRYQRTSKRRFNSSSGFPSSTPSSCASSLCSMLLTEVPPRERGPTVVHHLSCPEGTGVSLPPLAPVVSDSGNTVSLASAAQCRSIPLAAPESFLTSGRRVAAPLLASEHSDGNDYGKVALGCPKRPVVALLNRNSFYEASPAEARVKVRRCKPVERRDCLSKGKQEERPKSAEDGPRQHSLTVLRRRVLQRKRLHPVTV